LLRVCFSKKKKGSFLKEGRFLRRLANVGREGWTGEGDAKWVNEIGSGMSTIAGPVN
jgi:hypothetical protein